MEQWIKWFSKNHVAANFLMLAVLLVGFTTWYTLRKEIFPETSFDAVVITVPYPNATPDEVESGVIVPIEEAIEEVEGIKRITSTSARNIGTVTVEVETGYEVRNVMDDVKTKVDAIDNLAENAERATLEELIVNQQIMSIAVSADTDEKTLRRITEDVRDGLLLYQAPKPEGFSQNVQTLLAGETSIKKVELAAVRPYEISIEVGEDRLREYGMSLADVASAVRRASLDLPSGSVRTEAGEILVRAVGKRYTAAEFRGVVIRSLSDGSDLLLDDVAEVVDGFEEVDLSSSFDGRPAAILHVFSVGEQDSLAVARVAKSYLTEKQRQLPKGVTLEVWNDWSVMLKGRLDLLTSNIAWGLLYVLIVLALFLRPSLALLVALGIPVSFAGGLWMMSWFDISVNMISAFAFILVLGIVVDDAIVVGENVYTRIQGGENPKEAAWKGTHEVGVVVIFGVLTTMAAFTPMLGLSGVSGKIWPNIPLVVIPVLFFSLLQSKFVLPSHLAMLKPSSAMGKVGPITRVQRFVAGGLEKFVEKIYTPFLAWALRFRYLVLSFFIAVLVTSFGLVGGGWIPFEFMPKVEGEVLTAKLEMPMGVPFSQTEDAIERLEKASEELGKKYRTPDGKSILRHTLATAGMQPFLTGFAPGGPPTATHIGEVTIELVSSTERDISVDELKVEWQKLVGVIPGAVELSFKAETGASGNAIDVNLVGADPEVLAEAANWAKERLADYKGVIEISDSNRRGREEVRVKELTPRGKALGFDLQNVMSQVRDAFYGNEVQRLQRGRDELKVMVRYPKNERESLANFEQMKLRSPAGAEVPLMEVIVPEYARGPASITRVDRFRTIKLQADVDRTGNYNSTEIVNRFTTEALDKISTKFPGVRYTYEGEQKDQRESLREMGIGFGGALMLMYVLMAIPLRSYLQPLIVMSVIPFGFVGAIFGHMIMGLDLSIMSMCGIVALAGVVVNDSLVLVDYVNRHRAKAGSLREAAVSAGARRFRPILLTSLTTFVGLMPMLSETDLQARFLVPMAVSLGFGILFATLLTLVLLPSIYLILDDVTSLFSRKKVGE